jgi:hypothetical protein
MKSGRCRDGAFLQKIERGTKSEDADRLVAFRGYFSARTVYSNLSL